MIELFEINVTKCLPDTLKALHCTRYFVFASSKNEAIKKVDIKNATNVLIKRICKKAEIIE